MTLRFCKLIVTYIFKILLWLTLMFVYSVMGISKQIIIPIIYQVHSKTGILSEIHFHPYT